MQFIREMFSDSGSRSMHVDYFKAVFLCNLPNARDYTMNYNAIFNRTFFNIACSRETQINFRFRIHTREHVNHSLHVSFKFILMLPITTL